MGCLGGSLFFPQQDIKTGSLLFRNSSKNYKDLSLDTSREIAKGMKVLFDLFNQVFPLL